MPAGSTVDPNISRLIGPNGLFSQSLPGYEKRDGQIKLADAILRTLRQRGSLVAEAPTGSGKSAASLAALAVIVKEEREKKTGPAAILTGTIALQDQIAKKDAPAFVKLLDEPFTFAVLKGRKQYVCKYKFATAANSKDARTRQAYKRMAGWGRETLTGSRSECDFDDKTWRLFTSTGLECGMAGCPFGRKGDRSCYYQTAREYALSCDVIIANYHVALSRGVGGSITLNQFGHVICDEAHGLPNVARSSFGSSLSVAAIIKLSTMLPDITELSTGSIVQPGVLADEAKEVFGRLLLVAKGGSQKTVRLTEPGRINGDALVDMLLGISQTIDRTLDSGDKIEAGARAEMQTVARTADDYATTLVDANLLENPDSWVYWLETYQPPNPTARPGVTIERRPFLVGQQLRRVLFSRTDKKESLIASIEGGVVLMSATLRTTDTFDFIRREVGAPDDTKEIVCRSPFVLATQAALVVPDYVPITPKYGAPESVEHEYRESLTAAAAELALAMDGRTLCLFTSWAVLNYAFTRMTGAKTLKKFKIAKQGQRATQLLVGEFSRGEIDILLGVASLWQGIDIPGDALKGLFIHKIPFPSPQEPINAAMQDLIDRRVGKRASFTLWSIPVAAMLLQQGMGRLIRTTKDSGVCVIADRRLTEFGYGKRIYRSLPKFSRFNSINTARQVLPGVFSVRGK